MKAGAPLELLLVPRPFISSVLQLAHSHMLGAHLGVEKTLERIKARFYWPVVKKAVEDFCRSCPDCQQVAPHPHHRNPLIPLPIISVPFSRIGMDLVGPLPVTAVDINTYWLSWTMPPGTQERYHYGPWPPRELPGNC